MAGRAVVRPVMAGVLALVCCTMVVDAGAARETGKRTVAKGRRGAKRAEARRRVVRGRLARGVAVNRPAMTELVKGLVVENDPPEGTGQGNFVYRDHRGDAELSYVIRRNGTTMYLVHTGVRGALQGQGAGKRLVEEAVVWAAKQGLKVVPHCEFARREFDKAKERGDTRYAAVELTKP